MSRLDDAARSVPADPSTADDNAPDTTLDPNLDTKAAGDADTGDDGQGGDDGRSLENVRGELLRKMQKSNQEMMAELKDLRKQLQTPTAPAPVQSSQPQTLDEMTVDQLIQMQPNVPDEQKAAFDAYLIERKVDAKVDAKLSNFTNQTQQHQQEERYNAQAFDRWPQLRDKSSEFYGIADQVLSEMGSAGESDPRAVLAAANEAGLQLGLTPATGARRSRREPGNVAPGRTTRGTSAPEVDTSELDSNAVNRLAEAMPGKKFTKEQLQRIAKRTKLYKDGINSHVRG